MVMVSHRDTGAGDLPPKIEPACHSFGVGDSRLVFLGREEGETLGVFCLAGMPEERGGPLASSGNTQTRDSSGVEVPGASIRGCGSIETWVVGASRRGGEAPRPSAAVVRQPRHILLAAQNPPL